MNFQRFLESDEFILLDGGMGTMIQQSGISYEHNPYTLNVTQPDFMKSIHQRYLDAGSKIVASNTFAANGYKLKDCRYTVEELVSAGVANAKEATKGTDALVALDIGPIGMLMEPNGPLTFQMAYDYFTEVILAGKEADVIFFETMPDLYECKAGILAAKDHSDKPVICSMTYETTGRTFTGVSPACAAVTLEALGVDALGLNCSVGPKALVPMVKELSEYTSLPLFVKPNAGLPDPTTGHYDVGPEQFAEDMLEMLPLGAKLIGGCCGTNPDYIAALGKAVKGKKYTPAKGTKEPVVCSSQTVVKLDMPRIIGERINPTGKEKLSQAYRDGNVDYVVRMALEEVQGGAEIINVNVGLPGVEEAELLPKVIKALQAGIQLPLMIDTTDPVALEAALKAYNGKPIVNSVSGEEASLTAVLPLVAKYGANLVGLTLDDNGIPDTADGRVAVAKKIVARAGALGIPKKDLFIDCLTMTVSADQEGCRKTLEAIHKIKTELGCKTLSGVSNISFGLPNRSLLNRTFLTMALEEGLDLPIINPNVGNMVDVVLAYRVLNGDDKLAADYVSAFKDATAPKKAAEPKADEIGVFSAVYDGLESEGRKATEQLLETKSPLDVVNEQLIPALDKVGEDYDTGELFLPQLMQSAAAAQGCFAVIKEKMALLGQQEESKGKVILATVKGDIHDIGKDIVKVLLDNYGFTVLDLGKDVDPQVIVDTAVKEDVKAVGLSALMTTTLPSMEETIKKLRACKELQNPDGSSKVTVMVGGAVLTESYAKDIGANFYCKDAKETVDRCKELF